MQHSHSCLTHAQPCIYIYGQAKADLEEQLKEVVLSSESKKRVSSAVTEADTTRAVKRAAADSAWMEGKFDAARLRAHTYGVDPSK